MRGALPAPIPADTNIKWYRSAWAYRVKFTIDNTSNADTLENYEIPITIDHNAFVNANRSKIDGSDIRFTDESGKVQIPFWIESGLNSEACTIWVNVPLIPASEKVDIYMYHGNPNAPEASDMQATFMYATEFEEWENDNLADGVYPAGFSIQGDDGTLELDTDSGNRVVLKTTADDPNGGRAIVKNDGLDNFIATFRVKKINTSGASTIHIALGNNDSSNTYLFDGYSFYIGTFNNAGSDTYGIGQRDDSVFTPLTVGSDASWDLNTWYRLEFIRNGDSLTFNIHSDDGTLLQTLNTTDSTYTMFKYLYVVGGHDYYLDEIIIRKYTSPEPSAVEGADEARPDDLSKYYGLAISNTGFDVNTAEIKDLSFISNFDTLRVFHTGTLKVRFPAGYYSDPEYGIWTRRDIWYFDEPLGYVPLVMPAEFGLFGAGTPCGPTGFESCLFIPTLTVDSEKIVYEVTLYGGDELFMPCWETTATVFEYNYVIYRNPRFEGQNYAN